MSHSPTIASPLHSTSQGAISLKPASSSKLVTKKLQAALKLTKRLPETSFPKDLNKDPFIKIRQRKVTTDREQVYQENLRLKLKNQALKEEISQFKLKLIQSEQETLKNRSKELCQSEKPSSANTKSNLRETIKELKNQLGSINQENFKLKSNLKFKKSNELETEIQAYLYECTKLKHYLEETLRNYEELNQPENPAWQVFETPQKSYLSLEKFNKTLQEEGKGVKSAIESFQKRKKSSKKNKKTEIQKLKLNLEYKEKIIKEQEVLLSKLGKEEKPKQDFSLSLTKPNQFVPNFKPTAPAFFRVVQTCQSKTRGLTDFLALLKTMKSTQEVSDYIKQVYPKFNDSDLAEVLALFRITDLEVLHELIKEWFDFFYYDESFNWLNAGKEDPKSIRNEPVFKKTIKNLRKSPDLEEIQPRLQKSKALEHKHITAGRTSPIFLAQSDLTISQEIELTWMWEKISMALQINRLSSKEFFGFLPEKIDQKIFTKILSSKPFKISEKDAERYSNIIFLSIPVAEKSNISNYINELFKKNTKYWEVLTQEKEDLLNKELSKIIDIHRRSILEKCRSYDIKSTGKITLEQFRFALNSLGLRCSEDIWNYLKLLLYSCNEENNTAPYLYFIENYGKGYNSHIDTTETVKKYIEIIAEKLKQLKLTTKSAFSSTAGYIFPKQLSNSLEKLGIKDVPKADINALLQSLKDEQSEAPCIALDELQEILSNYGVEEIRADTSNDNEKTLKADIRYETYCESYTQEFND